MRRLAPLALAALVLGGCGTERPAGVEADPSFGPVPSPTVSPTAALPPPAPSPTPSPTPVETGPAGPLAAFPLGVGYAETNGDDGSPVTVTETPATTAFQACGQQVWDPGQGLEVIGVEFRGEAEWFRGRTLVLYPTPRAAEAAVDRAQDAIASCPREEGEDTGWAEHSPIGYYTGVQSFGWIDRWWEAELDGFDTGLSVYHVVRVGRAVLLTYDYGEGNGSAQTRRSAMAAAARADQPVVDRMAGLTTGDSTGETTRDTDEPLAIRPSGIGPFELGMTTPELRDAAPDARIREHTSCGATLSWTGPNGVEVSGGVSTSDGLAYVSARGLGAVTPEGAAVGESLADLYRTYPMLEPFGTGGSNAFLSDQGAAAYVFDLDGSRDLPSASDRHVVQIMVITDDQRCAS